MNQQLDDYDRWLRAGLHTLHFLFWISGDLSGQEVNHLLARWYEFLTLNPPQGRNPDAGIHRLMRAYDGSVAAEDRPAWDAFRMAFFTAAHCVERGRETPD
jgi:hypothetical protein